MAGGRKTYVGTASQTTLASGINSTDTTITLTDASTYGTPSVGAPMVIVIGAETVAEEQLLISSRSGNVLTVAASGRNWQAGGGTTGVSHAVGEVVRHVLDADSIDDANRHVNVDTDDDHSQYLKTDGTRALTGVTAIAAVAGASAPGDTAAKGSGPTLALSDHRHSREAAVTADTVIPAGMITPYAGTAAPTGWLLCDGSAVSRATYPALFTTVGVTYGAGNGTTTFNVPDLRQKFPLGKAASGTGSTLAGTGGSKDQTVTSHAHTVNSHSHGGVSGGQSVTHTHGVGGSGWFMTTDNSRLVTLTAGGGDAGQILITSQTLGASVGHTHSVAAEAPGTDSQGVSGTDANLPPWLAVNYLIKAH